MPVLGGQQGAPESGRAPAVRPDAAAPTRSHPVGALLAGSWRARPVPASIPAASLATSLPVLTSTGASGLAWNRIKRDARLSATGPAEALRRHAQALVLETARHETALGCLIERLDGIGIAPVLFKGRAAAQHYAQPHLRPMGDVDLCAHPGRFDDTARFLRSCGFRARSAGAGAGNGRTLLLASPEDWPGRRLLVDLHERLDKFFLGPVEAVFARSRTLRLGERIVPVPAAEDQLRIAAIHFLRDGGWRPLSLCDVAALLESLPPPFDWELCLGPDRRRRRWIACTFELAHALLGADLGAVPAAHRVPDMPSWLSRTVLRAWNKPFARHRPRLAFSSVLRHDRSSLPADALARWPNGIRASIELGAAFTWLPRWPYQFLFFAKGMARFALRASRAGPRHHPSLMVGRDMP